MEMVPEVESEMGMEITCLLVGNSYQNHIPIILAMKKALSWFKLP